MAGYRRRTNNDLLPEELRYINFLPTDDDEDRFQSAYVEGVQSPLELTDEVKRLHDAERQARIDRQGIPLKKYRKPKQSIARNSNRNTFNVNKYRSRNIADNINSGNIGAAFEEAVRPIVNDKTISKAEKEKRIDAVRNKWKLDIRNANLGVNSINEETVNPAIKEKPIKEVEDTARIGKNNVAISDTIRNERDSILADTIANTIGYSLSDREDIRNIEGSLRHGRKRVSKASVSDSSLWSRIMNTPTQQPMSIASPTNYATYGQYLFDPRNKALANSTIGDDLSYGLGHIASFMLPMSIANRARNFQKILNNAVPSLKIVGQGAGQAAGYVPSEFKNIYESMQRLQKLQEAKRLQRLDRLQKMGATIGKDGKITRPVYTPKTSNVEAVDQATRTAPRVRTRTHSVAEDLTRDWIRTLYDNTLGKLTKGVEDFGKGLIKRKPKVKSAPKSTSATEATSAPKTTEGKNVEIKTGENGRGTIVESKPKIDINKEAVRRPGESKTKYKARLNKLADDHGLKGEEKSKFINGLLKGTK